MADATSRGGEAPRQRVPPYVYAIVGVGLLSFASSPILVRYASEAPGLTLAAWRTLLAALFLAPFALPKIGGELRSFSRKEWGMIGSAGVLLGLHFVAWIESLYHTTVASASVLVTTSPIFIAVLGYLLLGERLSRRGVIAIAVSVPGAALIGLGDASGSDVAAHPLLGNALALGAAVIVSGYLLIGRVVRQRRSWLGYVFPLYTVVALTVWVLALLLGAPLFDQAFYIYGLCALMAIGPSILGHGSFNYALKYLSATILGILTLFEPVGASLAALVLFGEVPGLLAILGMLLVLVGVTLIVVPRAWWKRLIASGDHPVHEPGD